MTDKEVQQNFKHLAQLIDKNAKQIEENTKQIKDVYEKLPMLPAISGFFSFDDYTVMVILKECMQGGNLCDLIRFLKQ